MCSERSCLNTKRLMSWELMKRGFPENWWGHSSVIHDSSKISAKVIPKALRRKNWETLAASRQRPHWLCGSWRSRQGRGTTLLRCLKSTARGWEDSPVKQGCKEQTEPRSGGEARSIWLGSIFWMQVDFSFRYLGIFTYLDIPSCISKHFPHSSICNCKLMIAVLAATPNAVCLKHVSYLLCEAASVPSFSS